MLMLQGVLEICSWNVHLIELSCAGFHDIKVAYNYFCTLLRWRNQFLPHYARVRSFSYVANPLYSLTTRNGPEARSLECCVIDPTGTWGNSLESLRAFSRSGISDGNREFRVALKAVFNNIVCNCGGAFPCCDQLLAF